MKKLWAAVGALILLIGAYVVTRKSQTLEPETSLSPSQLSTVSMESVPPVSGAKVHTDAEKTAEASVSAHREALALFTNVLGQGLTLEGLETLAAERDLVLEKANKGHPKTGQRLEVSFAAPYPVQVVYDIKGEGQAVFQAARMVFPEDSDLNALKQDAKTQVNRAIASESAESLIFVDDSKGQTLWLGRTEDGRIQLALELNIHPQGHGGP